MYYAHGFEKKNTKIAYAQGNEEKLPKITYVIVNVCIGFSSYIYSTDASITRLQLFSITPTWKHHNSKL